MATLTRRQVLIGIGAGTGALAVSGAGALVLRDGSGNGQQSHHVPASGVKIVSGHMASTHMGGTVGWTISTPSRPARAVIYCLHGYGSDHNFTFDEIRLPDVVESLQAPLAVAAVDGGADSYWHPRSDGTDALAMLFEEFIPFVEKRTSTSRRALLGWSMGGYGSLLAAERAPERFFAVTVASPALWTSPDQTAPGAFDGPADYHRFDVFEGVHRLAGLVTRVDCGTGDPFLRATRRFVASLPAGHQGTFGPGQHESRYWRGVAPAQVTTITQALLA